MTELSQEQAPEEEGRKGGALPSTAPLPAFLGAFFWHTDAELKAAQDLLQKMAAPGVGRTLVIALVTVALADWLAMPAFLRAMIYVSWGLFWLDLAVALIAWHYAPGGMQLTEKWARAVVKFTVYTTAFLAAYGMDAVLSAMLEHHAWVAQTTAVSLILLQEVTSIHEHALKMQQAERIDFNWGPLMIVFRWIIDKTLPKDPPQKGN